MCEAATISAVIGYVGSAASSASAYVAANAAAFSAAATAASTAAAAYSQHQTAKANEKNARESQADQEAMLQDRAFQESAAGGDQMTERSKQAVRDLGTLNALFADSNLSGNTQDRLSAEVKGLAAADIATIDRNRGSRGTQTAAESAAIRARAQSQLNSTPYPSILGAGLKIASTSIDYYDKSQGGSSSRRPVH